jgi:GH25 family lysozyme M1 (1,4-beta-N-acetylmuramidase)
VTRRIDCVDVSSMNAVDWTKIADHNITFGIVRFREFSTVAAQDDPRFREWWPAMRKAGLIRGAFLLLDPSRNASRADLEREAQHFIDAIESVGGLEPGDLPLSVDYEQVGQNPPNVQACLNQLAWLLHPLETYLQTAMRRPDAKPIIYTGRNTWINVIQDHGAAFVTNDANAADRLTIDFSTYPLWWAWLANDALDPMNAAQMATIRSPVAWRATPPKSIILQYSGHVEIPGHEAEDGSVIAQIDTAGPITLSNDFTPLLSLARVAPPTADVELTRVTDLSDQPPDQVFSLLLIGQGFWADEFADVVQQGLFGRFTAPVGPMGAVATVHARQGLADIAPLNLLAANAGRNAFACYYDAGTHADGTGLSLPLRQERVRGTGLDPITGNPVADQNGPVDALRIPHQVLVVPQTVPPGRSLAEYLSRLTVRLSDGTIRRATEFWPIGQKRTGPKGALIAVLRRAPFVTHNAAGSVPDAPRPAELYQLDPTTDDPVPCIAVNVVPGGDWPLVLARAIAQNLAGLADEYELEGAGFTQPPEGVANPLAPNVVVLDDTRRQALVGGGAVTPATVPQPFAAWSIPAATAVDFVAHAAAAANPVPAWNGVSQSYGLGDFHLVEGGAGFRSHVLRCDKDCLMRRIPAAIGDTVEPAGTRPPALPIQSTMRVFCKACEARLRSVITSRIDVNVEPRIEIDTQRRLFDAVRWRDRTDVALTSERYSSTATTFGPRWSCSGEFSGGGFRFTDIDLANADYWAQLSPPHVAHVLKSVAFEGFELKFRDGTTRTLALADALAQAQFPPKFAVSLQGDASGTHQFGARLAVSWLVQHSPNHTCIVDAELSLVLAGMNNDIDPAGIMVGCRLYPQIAMRVRSATPGTNPVDSLRGTVTLVANNATPSNFTQPFTNILNGRLKTSLFCESNRAAVDTRKRSALRTALVPGMEPLLPAPYWSAIYDYANVDIAAAASFTAVNARVDGAPGTAARDQAKTWPAGQTTSVEAVHKLPRHAAYDALCIHPDLGADSEGRAIIGAPICADLGLHLHWRRGMSFAGGPAPRNVLRGWGAGRLGQGAHSVLGAPAVPPNQRVAIEVTPAANQSTVTVKYTATATEIATGRWNVFLEQGLAFAFQYAIEGAVPWQIPSLSFGQQAWLAAAVGAGTFDDVRKQLKALDGQPNPLDAAVRTLWWSIMPRLRFFDATLDGSAEQQVPSGPSDPALERL